MLHLLSLGQSLPLTANTFPASCLHHQPARGFDLDAHYFAASIRPAVGVDRGRVAAAVVAADGGSNAKPGVWCPAGILAAAAAVATGFGQRVS
jgi:hypothetical protein